MIALLATGCETNRWEEHERKLIDDYIKSIEDTVYVLYPSGLYYIELIPGTGSYPVDLDTVYFKYKAAFTNYVQFDSNDPYTKPYKYVIGKYDDVILGVDEGLRYMKVGGTSRLLTPSSLAWGFEGIPGIVAGTIQGWYSRSRRTWLQLCSSPCQDWSWNNCNF
jgi:FKBP-type peptidyl-prolyl cis-trans isomerase